MKRFILRTILFLLPLAVLMVLFENSQRQAPHEFKYKAQFMEQHASELEVLVMGLSYTHRMNLNFWGYKSFNLSYSNQATERDYALWMRYRDELTSLKYVVYPLSCWFHQNRSTGIESWRTPFYTIHYNLPAPMLDLQKRFITANPKIATKRLGSILSGDEASLRVTCDRLGSSTPLLKDRPEDWEGKSGEFMAHRHSDVDPENARANRETLTEMVADFEKRGIRVILVTPPTWHTYYDYLSDEVVRMTEELGEELQKEFSNVRYVNMLKDKRFVKDDFFDDSHLNYDVGGRKWAELLRQEIEADQKNLAKE